MSRKTKRQEVSVVARVSELLLGRRETEPAKLQPARLMESDNRRLAQAAEILGVTGVDAEADPKVLAVRVAEAIARVGAGEGSASGSSADSDDINRAKYDLGFPEEAAPPRHIPWSYGRDRITAMVVNPRTLYLYWEISDQAIEHGREGLGFGGKDAWLNLRVYDVSGRIFDGTNAHSYFDVKVDRTDRQWFLEVGKPGSTAIIELGMKSLEGFFVKLARSGRVDFPRHTPAPTGPVEWLTVRTASGDVGAPLVGGPPLPPTQPGAGAPPATDGTNGAQVKRSEIEQVLWRMITERIWGEGLEVIRREWTEAGRTFEWMGPFVRTTWAAGPFTVPVEIPGLVTDRYQGPVAIDSNGGRTHIVFGPWRVVIRGLGGWAEKRVLATWNVSTSWLVREEVVRELRRHIVRPSGATGGGSEMLLEGASEQRWMYGSEARLAGASEVYFLGASELCYLGGSETLLLGASEYGFLGASETLAEAGSQWRLGAASEQMLGGASEIMGGSGSELRLGDSELRGGASEEGVPPSLD